MEQDFGPREDSRMTRGEKTSPCASAPALDGEARLILGSGREVKWGSRQKKYYDLSKRTESDSTESVGLDALQLLTTKICRFSTLADAMNRSIRF